MAAKRRRRRNPVSRKVSAKVSRHLLARDARARAAYPRTRSYRRRARGRRRLRKNPSSKALVAALVGAGLAGFAWHMYVQSATGQGATLDGKLIASVGGGAVAGYLVGGKI